MVIPASSVLRLYLTAALMLMGAAAISPAGAEAVSRATISLSGIAEVSAAPDRASIVSGVVTEAETAREALDLNSAAIARVIAALKEAGIEPRDIATSGFSIEPRYHYPSGRDGEHRPPRIVGYQVTNQVTVRVRDLDRLGEVLDRTVTVGANRVHSIRFEVSDADRRLDEARAEAVGDARRKAEVYAEAAGVELLRILTISEGRHGDIPRPLVAAARMEADAQAVPIEAGEQTLTIRVDIVWEISQ